MNEEQEQELFDDFDIRIFNTLGGRQLIGILEDVDDEAIFLQCVLECKTVVSSADTYKTTFLPAIPYADHDEPFILHIHAIESEMTASETLKGIYFNQLVYNNLTSLLSKHLFDQHCNNQSNNPDLAQQDFWKDFKDQMLS
jgi:hypothetical protein